jgi:hypothetical protein
MKSLSEVIESVENNNLGSIYSKEDVIKMLNSIAIEEGNAPFKIDALVKLIETHICGQISDMSSDNACDFSSAEFSLSYNTIELDCVDLEPKNIASEATNGLEDVIADFLKGTED